MTAFTDGPASTLFSEVSIRGNATWSKLVSAGASETMAQAAARAYLDTVCTRPEARAHKRMKLVLTAAHRELHNRMHQAGLHHKHSPGHDHPEHH